MRLNFIFAAALALVLLAGCLGQAQTAAPASNGTSPGAGGASPNQAAGNTSAQAGSQNSDEKVNMMNPNNPIVVFETTKGTFKAEIFVKEAPITGGNFMKLVNSGFYDGLTFHRVITGFMAQGGDPKGDGSGGSNQTIPLEIVPGLTHHLGSLGMARSQAPDSASSQFYIVNGQASFLDGQYAVFGQVLGNGMDVVNQFAVGEPPKNPDKMIKVYEQK